MKHEEIYESDQDIKTELIQASKQIGRKELKERLANLNTSGKRSFLRVWWAAAAMILVLVAAVLLMRPQSSDALYAANYSKLPNKVVSITRSEGDNQDRDLKLAMIAYQRGDYAEASDAFKLLAERHEDVMIYQGIIAMEEDDFSSAIDILEPLSSDGSYRLQKEAQWYLALSYLIQDMRNEAKFTLEALVNEEGDYQEKARSILEKL